MKAMLTKAAVSVVMAAATTAGWAQGYGDAGRSSGDPKDVPLSVGAGVALVPQYMGSDRYKAAGLLVLNGSKGAFYADPMEGMGFRHLVATGTEFSLRLGQDPGRKEKKHAMLPGSDRLRGMGEVKSGITTTLGLKQHVTDWLSLSGEYTTRLTRRGHAGSQYGFGLEVRPFAMQDTWNDTGRLTVGLHLNAGSKDFNQAYFGVTDAQSRQSGYGAHALKAGLHSTSLRLKWQRDFSRHWGMYAGAEAVAYTSKVRKSPIVQADRNYRVFAALTYTF